MMKRESLEEVGYYYITDDRLDLSPVEQTRIAVDKGVRMIQYRNKNGEDIKRLEEVKEMSEICREKALLIVNDRPDIALLGEADGVHLGQEDLPPDEVRGLTDDLLIGVSTHNEKQAEIAEEKADYIAVGPVHKTTTKEDVAPELGIEKAKEIADSAEIPTAAIGGIGVEDLESLTKSFDMICAVSSVTQKGDLSERISYFEEKIGRLKVR